MNPMEKVQSIFDYIRSVNDEPSAEAGISREEVVSTFDALGLNVPAALIDLYTWHNGIYHLNAFLHLPSLAESARSYTSLAEFKGEWPDAEWEKGWFPVLDLNGSLQVCVDVSSGAVHCIDIVSNQSWPLAEHFEHCLDALRDAIAVSALEYSETSGAFEAGQAWAAIASKYNLRRAW